MEKNADLLHIVEPGGRGGVYQHVLGAIQNGTYDKYSEVVIHTAKDAELTPAFENVAYCHCMRYQRMGPRGLRAVASLFWVLAFMLPHLFVSMLRRPGEWEVQGLFGKGIYTIFVIIPKLGGHKTTFVPHNSFSRNNSKMEIELMRWALRLASRVVVFVDAEINKFDNVRILERRRLWQYLLKVDPATIEEWKERVGASGRPVVAFIGQLREDKNPELLLEAASSISNPLTLVFAGQDKGAVQSIRNFALASHHERIVIDSYLDSVDFQALIMVSTVVVCPYEVASQSGVLALATQLGTPVIASNVGGLSEQADVVFEVGGKDAAAALASALNSFLS
ncbi:glycosyltransferase [Kocuria sp. LUK]|uniref:glycosyltransferase n=1 Tax=Kocuria sp. LUK TaxID=2897828 RepID=UPI001E358CD7|nr:glycosyltransferase [Kocuria sp. LUK]MCD1144953.1 glycosyltransferase [Kocuria sp. LUK]